MKRSCLARIAIVVFAFWAASGLTLSAQTLSALVSFDGTNGASPAAPLIQASDGNLYGTAEFGGPVLGCEGGFAGCGTVFKVTTSGTLTTLHTFVYSDGAWPVSPVVQGTDGNFYGTNQGEGDSGGSGAIFKMTPSGTLTVLDFVASGAGLVQGRDGNFYGTYNNGYNHGVVFKITPSGTLTTLYTFSGPDGASPQSGVIQGSDGNFYGTTAYGGTNNYGTVFKLTPSGSLTTLHNFALTDGQNIVAGLVQGSDGNFYGTAAGGGTGGNNAGNVFKITPSGTFNLLHAFNGTDGYGPRDALIQASDGNFYGTTFQGGDHGQGTIFAIAPSGSLTTLYSFCPQSGCADGAGPVAGVVQASDGNFYGTTTGGGSDNLGTIFQLQVPVTTTLTVSTVGDGSVTSSDGFINCPGTCSHTYQGSGAQLSLSELPGHDWIFGGWSGGCVGTGACNLTMTGNISVGAFFSQNLQMLTATPCRLVDTRTTNSPINGGTSQNFAIPQLGGCNIPSSATAYSLNVTVVPHEPLGYLTIWPAGAAQPTVSTMNSLDGRTKANAAIVPAGTNGAVSVFASNTTDVILDIDGYFTSPGSETLEFYPLTPCRVIDTRNTNGDLGGPSLTGGQPRNFPVTESACLQGIASAEAYSFNFTVVPTPQNPTQPLGYLTVWPKGGSQPVVSTLNNLTATVVANGAIVPAGSDGGISVFASNNTDLVVDINGYFASAGSGGLQLYPVAPCRVIDTRNGGGAFTQQLNVPVTTSPCEPPSAAQAYVFNATVVPSAGLGYLTLWPDGENQPVVSTLNALDGMITSNMAIVPSTNGTIDAFASNLTQLVLDISSYFAP